MRIKTWLRLAAIAPLVLVLVLAWIYSTTAARVEQIQARAGLTGRIMVGVFELNMMAQEFVRHRGDRAQTLWQKKHREVGELLAQLSASGSEEQDLLALIHHSHDQSLRLFEQLLEVPNKAVASEQDRALSKEWSDRLAEQLLLNSHQMVSAAQTVGGASRAKLVNVQRTADHQMLLLMFSFCAASLTMMLVAIRKVTMPLAQLEEAVRIVGGGDLGHRTGITTNDEIGHFAQAFDQMLERLDSVMASRDELRQEIAERERVEERLRAQTAELSARNSQLIEAKAGLARLVQELEKEQLRLEVAAKNLERSNKALQEFAYVASHDLQEPLRMVSSYLQLLERRYKSQLDDDADKFIGYAVDGAIRMKTLINDLLAYSRITTRGKPIEWTNCEQVLTEAIANLEVPIRENEAQITHGPLPNVMSDSGQLRQVFQNLIGNALKYRGEETPQIYVEAERNHNVWQFSVRDNGIGIDPQFAQRVFVIFQRLHTRDEYPGTGIGLAICKRIVERHGGTIWVESQIGQGATFSFTIPATEDSEERTNEGGDNSAG